MCNGLYWVCTHSGNTDDENMNVFVIFFTDNNESCESLWKRVCVKEPDGLREEALPQSLCLCHQAIKHRIDFKILLITYKALNGLAPQYLSELLSHYSPSRPLRSQNSGCLIIPRISKSTAGGRSFSCLAPKLWNNLPNTVREADTLCQFKSRLKTHFFYLAYT